MSPVQILQELEQCLSHLPQEKQQEVLDFARYLSHRRPLPKGASPQDLLKLEGTLPDEDAAELVRIIEEEFEQVEPSDW